MKSITIHNLDDLSYQKIFETAQLEGISMNALIKRLLSKSLGVSIVGGKNDISAFKGEWSDAEHKAFTKTQEVFEKIDIGDWQ